MYFESVALEQASDEIVATYKASRFPREVLVIDLCCGIGGDLIALANRGPVVGVDFSPVRGWMAAENVQANRESSAKDFLLLVCSATDVQLDASVCWHIDPDRRARGSRSVQLRQHSPDQSQIEKMLRTNENGSVKLAPATDVPMEWESKAELEWIGHSRQCHQLMAWFGSLAKKPGQRRATVLPSKGFVQVAHDQSVGHTLEQCKENRHATKQAGTLAESLVGEPHVAIPIVDKPWRYFFEPQAAVLAADLTGELAAQASLATLAPGMVYLTGDEPLHSRLFASFEVLDLLPLHEKRLRQYLRKRNVGHVDVKKRGVDIDPAKLCKRLRGQGEEHATLVITRIGPSVVVLIVRRLGQDDKLP